MEPDGASVMETASPRTISWGDFAELEPELALFGAGRLTALPAYLATVRRSGAPRVHPVSPIFTEAGLFLYMEPTSPKGGDLRNRGWFALHSGVPDNAGTGGEFCVTGLGFEVEDPDIWSEVSDAASYTPVDRYLLFEFLISEARCHGYGDVAMPSTQKWSVDRSSSII